MWTGLTICLSKPLASNRSHIECNSGWSYFRQQSGHDSDTHRDQLPLQSGRHAGYRRTAVQ
jgi:hypothetical protein